MIANPPQIELREVREDDLPLFFEHQLDPEANHMAAFTVEDPSDRDAFMEKWTMLRASDAVNWRAIVTGDELAGSIVAFDMFGDREISYGLGRRLWGKGIATAALRLFLSVEQSRPLHARAVADNLGSIRVLEKCGFKRIGHDKGFANARGKEIEEVIMRLD